MKRPCFDEFERSLMKDPDSTLGRILRKDLHFLKCDRALHKELNKTIKFILNGCCTIISRLQSRFQTKRRT